MKINLKNPSCDYVAPQVECVTIEVEHGFAGSGTIDDYTENESENGWN